MSDATRLRLHSKMSLPEIHARFGEVGPRRVLNSFDIVAVSPEDLHASAHDKTKTP